MDTSIYFKISKGDKADCTVKSVAGSGKEEVLGGFTLELEYVTPLQIALGCYEDLYDSVVIKESSDKYVTLIEKATHEEHQMEEDSIDVFLSELLDRSQDDKTEEYLETIDKILESSQKDNEENCLSYDLNEVKELVDEGLNEDSIYLLFALKQLSKEILKGPEYKHGLTKLINSIDLKEIKKISKDYYNKFKGAKEYIGGM